VHGTGALDQPTARSIQIQGHDLRTLTARRLAELRRLVIGYVFFEALVAKLPTNEVISNYLAYSIGMHVDVFMHGILIRVDDRTDLDSEGINFQIDREGYDCGFASAQMTSLGMGNPNFSSLLTSNLIGVDSTVVDFQLFGYLSPGDNLILFTEPNPGGSYVSDPLGGIIENGTGGNDCQLPDPPCKTEGTCNPPRPGGADMGLPTVCVDKWLKLGPEMTPSCGSGAGFSVCTTHKGGVSWGAEIGIPETIEFEIGGSGEVSGTHCTNVSADGGYKVKAYQCFKICTRSWECSYFPWYSFTQRDYTKSTSCVISGGIATATCQFEVCSGT
jgi:hypothetical protein